MHIPGFLLGQFSWEYLTSSNSIPATLNTILDTSAAPRVSKYINLYAGMIISRVTFNSVNLVNVTDLKLQRVSMLFRKGVITHM